MASDLTGMFQQLNQAIMNNPMTATDLGQRLVDQTSQGFGRVGGALLGNDPMSYMTPGAKQQQGMLELGRVQDMGTAAGMDQAASIYGRMGDSTNQLALSQAATTKRKEQQEEMMHQITAQLDMTSPEGLRQAAVVYRSMGKHDEALAMIKQAQELQQAQDAELAAGEKEIEEGSIRTKAMAMAMQRGDRDAHTALAGGFLSPEEYYAQILSGEEKAREFENQKALETAKNENRSVPVFVERANYEAATAAMESEQNAGVADKLVEDFERELAKGSGPRGGVIGGTEEGFRRIMGSPDAVSNLKIRYYQLRNSQAVKNLPPGAASDADVQLALQGWPGDDAPISQIISFLRGMAKMERASAEYNYFKANYVSENKTTLGVASAWAESKKEENANKVVFGAVPK